MSPGTATLQLQRVGFLAAVPFLLSRLGVNPIEILEALNLDPHALDDPDGAIPFETAALILKLSVEKTGLPHLGLEIGKLIRTPALGLVGELMRNAPTLGDALIDFASYHHRNSRGGVVYVFKSEHEAFFGYGVYQPNVAAHQVICDVVAMAAYNLVAELVGNYQTRHLEALLSRSAPLDLGPYVEAFGEKLKFDQAQTAVRLSHKMLDLPIKNSDAELRKSLEQRLQEKNVLGDLDTLSELRRAVRVGLLQGHSSAIEISMQMRLGKRTLQRRLDEYGIGFQQLLDESRCEFTQQLLANTKLEVSEIANIVGYGDPSVLTRSFTRWTGISPSEWRSNLKVTRQ